MTAGHTAYYDVKIRAGDDITVASSIAEKPEAEWLVQQMIAARKKIAAPGPNP
jgi:hypothetical protein